jgi:hypothetical protein
VVFENVSCGTLQLRIAKVVVSDVAIGAIKQVGGSTTARLGLLFVTSRFSIQVTFQSLDCRVNLPTEMGPQNPKLGELRRYSQVLEVRLRPISHTIMKLQLMMWPALPDALLSSFKSHSNVQPSDKPCRSCELPKIP